VKLRALNLLSSNLNVTKRLAQARVPGGHN